MYLADCHNHTCISSDSTAQLSDMIRAAAAAGLSELCTTDHLDLVGHQGVIRSGWDWSASLEQHAKAKDQCPPGMELRLGVELGSAQFFPEWAARLVEEAGSELDLVLGSAHNISLDLGGWDFIEYRYTDEDMCHTILDNYFHSLEQMSRMPLIDVLSHLPYVLRYMNDRDGNHITLEPHAHQVDSILRNIIHRGAGIEFNTNRSRGDTAARWRPILERYRQLGGEIITLGSDAHLAEHVGLGIADAARLLKELGYRYYTVYRHRKPEFIPL